MLPFHILVFNYNVTTPFRSKASITTPVIEECLRAEQMALMHRNEAIGQMSMLGGWSSGLDPHFAFHKIFVLRFMIPNTIDRFDQRQARDLSMVQSCTMTGWVPLQVVIFNVDTGAGTTVECTRINLEAAFVLDCWGSKAFDNAAEFRTLDILVTTAILQSH